MEKQIQLRTQNIAIQQKTNLQLPFHIEKAPIDNLIAYEKKGHWTQKEKLKYIFFLQFFKEKFTTRNNKRFCRIFKVMSDFIKTRTHNQCRSHHQKMEKEKYEVDSIIENVSSKYHPRVFQQLYKKYQLQMMNLDLQDIDEPLVKVKTDRLKKQFYQVPSENGKQSNFNKKTLKKQNLMENLKIKSNNQVKQEYYHQNSQGFWNPTKGKNLPPTSIQYRQEEVDEQIKDAPFMFDIPLLGQGNQRQGQLFNKSLDFPMQYPTNSMTMQTINTKYPLEKKLQILQQQRFMCINRANYHYNEMQKNFQMAEQVQRQKLMALYQDREYCLDYGAKKTVKMPPMPWNYKI